MARHGNPAGPRESLDDDSGKPHGHRKQINETLDGNAVRGQCGGGRDRERERGTGGGSFSKMDIQAINEVDILMRPLGRVKWLKRVNGESSN